jgi:Tol biopolymer transport system component
MSSVGRTGRVLAPPLALLASLLTATAALATVSPVKVVVDKGWQESPFANGTYVAWTSNSEKHPKIWNAFARPLSGGSRIRLNAGGTKGFTGGFDPGTDSVIYQQVDGGRSDIYLYDLDTAIRTKVEGVSSDRWEWSPRISSSFILFNRDYRKNGNSYTSNYLYDRTTGTTRKLGTWPDETTYVPMGSVGAIYASWSVCNRSSCSVHLYDIASGTSTRVPTKNRRPQYAPAVDETNGRIYLVRSGFECGAGVLILRLPLDDLSATPTKIVDLPDGIDTGYVMSLAPSSNGTDQDLLFERWRCRASTSDIYRAPSVTTVPDA